MSKVYTKNLSVSDVCDTGMTNGNGVANAVLKAPVHLFNLLLVWQDRAISRAKLRDLDARFLSDVGLDRADAIEEARKPFWVK